VSAGRPRYGRPSRFSQADGGEDPPRAGRRRRRPGLTTHARGVPVSGRPEQRLRAGATAVPGPDRGLPLPGEDLPLSTTSGSPSGSSTPRGYGRCHGLLRELRAARRRHQGPDVLQRGRACRTAGLRPVLPPSRAQQGLPGDLARDRAARVSRPSSYTRRGATGTLVGNNIPVFFIPGRHQVPRPDPTRPKEEARPRLPAGAGTAHDNFLGLRVAHARVHATCSLWIMSGPGHTALVPPSWEGFGVHTFRPRQRGGPGSTYVKFHWKPTPRPTVRRLERGG